VNGRPSDATEAEIEKFLNGRPNKVSTITEIANGIHGRWFNNLKDVANSIVIEFNVPESFKTLESEGGSQEEGRSQHLLRKSPSQRAQIPSYRDLGKVRDI